ncbi:MAG: hypothetical protein ACR2PO_06410, partial [Methyloligellaceae bacterium]
EEGKERAMRTISLLVTVLAVYCGIILLAAWSISGITRYTTEPSGPAIVASKATLTGTALQRSKPVTRWDRPARSSEPTYYHDGGDDEDHAPATMTTVQRSDPKPEPSSGAINCFVGYDAMKKAARL